MKTDLYTKIVLTVIAVVLTVNLLKDVDFVTKAYAGKNEMPSLNVEKQDVRDCNNYTGYYAKDDRYVYFNGEKVPGASIYSTEALSGGYAKDYTSVYFRGKLVQGAKPDKFTVLVGGYGKDSNTAYYNGVDIRSNPSDFKVLSN